MTPENIKRNAFIDFSFLPEPIEKLSFVKNELGFARRKPFLIIEARLCVLRNYQKSVLNRKGKFRIHEWNFEIGSPIFQKKLKPVE